MAQSKTRLKRPEVADPAKELREWLTLLEELVRNVQEWAGEEWSTRIVYKPMNDSILGKYDAPGLLMQRLFTRVLLEPIARFAPGTDGVVDMSKMPAYDDVANLYRIEGEWRLHQASRWPKPMGKVRSADSHPLDEANLRLLLDEFASHAS